MIVYNLRCQNRHEFEGWFKDSATFDSQAKAGRVVCPICDSKKVEKAIMAPAVAGAKKLTTNSDERKKVRQFMTGLRKYVQENADYVGPKFAEEARNIHYGKSEERHIYGEATLKEAKDLLEEGVDVAPLPPDLDSAN
ncbi:MAG TPA: DUF1178 family protein [Rhizomicrobium sp.]|nr:DUF1178 family protein [Rhizomicrobium sp.]